MLQAFATDNAAAVKVTGDAVENGKLGGKAAITVTSADESETKTYTVTFKAFTLASLKVTGPTKTEYAIGDKLDTAGLKVTAVYQSGDKTKEVPVALDDPQLAIGSFDSTTAGKKAITVSYRGVTATFNVTVKANAVAPGPEEQKPGSTNKPGATGNGNKNTVANTGFQCCRHRWRCRSAGRCRGCIVHAAQACIAPSHSNGGRNKPAILTIAGRFLRSFEHNWSDQVEY